jgi:hypothetical protein
MARSAGNHFPILFPTPARPGSGSTGSATAISAHAYNGHPDKMAISLRTESRNGNGQLAVGEHHRSICNSANSNSHAIKLRLNSATSSAISLAARSTKWEPSSAALATTLSKACVA